MRDKNPRRHVPNLFVPLLLLVASALIVTPGNRLSALPVLPLQAEKSPKVEVLVGRHLGRTPPIREYLATHPEPPIPEPRIIPPPRLSIQSSEGGVGRASGGAPGSLLTGPMLSTDSTASTGLIDPVLQSSQGTTKAPAPIAGFDGISTTTVVPPDANISVGPNQVVETVNFEFQVFDKAGNGLLPNGPAQLSSIFEAAAGGNVITNNHACPPSAPILGGFGIDPVVLFDKIDQRWLIGAASGSDYCLAISTSSDATGSYDAYDISFPANVFGQHALLDSPKMAIWADGSSWSSLGRYAGVYFSAVQLWPFGFTDNVVCGFPLSQVSLPPPSLNWVCGSLSAGTLLPADIEGSPGASSTTLPAPIGTPEYYGVTYGGSAVGLFQFGPDFNMEILPAAPSQPACLDFDCVPQSGTLQELEALGGFTMYRLSYRNFGTRESMVVNESVQGNPDNAQVGVRWYQLSNPTPGVLSGWKIAQQGTFAPDDGVYRWMGSIAQDKFGDLGLGYSTSSQSSYPGIAYNGQTPSDPVNTLEAEYQAFVGPASQTATGRWGDYSSMSLDPTDDCTFWYVNEYALSGISFPQLGTHVVSFRLGDCEEVPFSSLSTKLEITAGPPPGFQMYANFTLGAGGSIDPLTQPITLQVGNYSVTIPPGSFGQLQKGSKAGSYVYSGMINGISLQIQIVPLGGSSYAFKVGAQPVDLTGLSNPVTVTITIGNNSGTVGANAQFL
jgi:hypothetical protein